MTKKTLILTAVFSFFSVSAFAQYMGSHSFLSEKVRYDNLSAQEQEAIDARVSRAVGRKIECVLEPIGQWVEDRVYETFGSTCASVSGRYRTYDWAHLVKSEERNINRNGPLGSSCYAVTTPSFPQKQLHENAQEYAARFRRLQAAMKQNAVLKNYKLVVPNPDDLVLFDAKEQGEFGINMDALVKWLGKDTSHSQDNQMECSKRVPGVIGISFTRHHPDLHVGFNLWIDARTKTVYFLRNGEYYGKRI